MFFWVIFSLQLFTKFVIGIDISKCPPLRLPTNGYVVCDHLIGAFCAPVCNPGFVPETQPAQAYVCNPLRNAWATYPGGYPLPWPNCIRSTKQDENAQADNAIKKSIVGQQTVSSVNQQIPGSSKESLWQRMLSLTSQLTQSKFKQDSGGAARSLQTPSSSSSDNSNSVGAKPKGRDDSSVSSNNNLIGSDNSVSGNNNLNLYKQMSPYSSYDVNPTVSPTQSEEEKKLQNRRLQQYWDEYYKRYYQSIGKGKLPDWMMRSPWSNDPEQVQGALDTDLYNLVGLPESKSSKQNMNNYLQNYYLQYPRPDANVSGADSENMTQPPNSSSDTFIDNVIESDLESKNILDRNANRDLYYEDQLIHKEEKKRPRLNSMNYVPTTHYKANDSAMINYSSNNTANSHQDSSYLYQGQNNSQSNYKYNTTAYPNGIGQQTSSMESNVSGSYNSSLAKSSAMPGYNSEQNDTQNSAQNSYMPSTYKSSSTENDTTAADPYERYTQYFKEYYKKVQNSSRTGGDAQPSTVNSGVNTQGAQNASSDSAYSLPSQVEANVEPSKVPKQNHLVNLLKATSKEGITDQVAGAYVPGEDVEDDGPDYLDQLDISALVRELIKLETIRKERRLARKKHLQQEQSREAVSLVAGDLMRGYFKSKTEPAQKGLKKHLLHKVRRLMKQKPNQSPLPKFNR